MRISKTSLAYGLALSLSSVCGRAVELGCIELEYSLYIGGETCGPHDLWLKFAVEPTGSCVPVPSTEVIQEGFYARVNADGSNEGFDTELHQSEDCSGEAFMIIPYDYRAGDCARVDSEIGMIHVESSCTQLATGYDGNGNLDEKIEEGAADIVLATDPKIKCCACPEEEEDENEPLEPLFTHMNRRQETNNEVALNAEENGANNGGVSAGEDVSETPVKLNKDGLEVPDCCVCRV
ncbi:hypothetical protein SARC_02859 [Sphaeroforma arctica JP610]|uniref:Uncharacterized protein n=1 Tax=Sphaeroforma arctica JP610 TaxID=667725 RepID=A0A0L0G7B8_9EUKA|nr:hypothetical protein SARC_02859 [Sphaeroforma arctica JP610]KNC84937.1 hypothetical protein SARC_02859 [Sphaeroforma arctica JP610]|eukprot:XP_014158839.1 hypothetical protein SARC_02859 [Sphaeroforma arctica JP610]